MLDFLDSSEEGGGRGGGGGGDLQLLADLLNSKGWLLNFGFLGFSVSVEVVEQLSRVFLTGVRFECMKELGFVFCEGWGFVAEILLDHSMSVRALPVFFLEH